MIHALEDRQSPVLLEVMNSCDIKVSFSGYHSLVFGLAFDCSFIAILTVTSSIVINVPTRRLLAVETKDSFVLWLAKFKYQKICL